MNYKEAIAQGYFFLIASGSSYLPLYITNDVRDIKEAIKIGNVITAHSSIENAKKFSEELEKKGQH